MRFRTPLLQGLLLCFAIANGVQSAAATAAVATPAVATYVGSDACAACHQAAYDSWKGSHHYRAMQIAAPDTVLGNFDNVEVEFHGIKSRFYREKNRYLVETLSNSPLNPPPNSPPNSSSKKGREAVEIRYTFGFQPLQQYLVEREKGHIQALNLAWDDRPVDVGGQKWFHLREEEITPDSPFFWTRHLQNWNARCADCHSTGVSKNFDRKQGSYSTTFSEPNVACEACHGPASDHVNSVSAGKPAAPLVMAHQSLRWQFHEGEPIARPKGLRNVEGINMCGGCHSRRSVLGETAAGKSFSDQFQISLLDADLYFDDGQINDEVFVLGSFLQSRMYSKGVTCMNCHDAHSGALKYEGNGLCGQCHDPATYDVARHSRHTPEQAMCVDCHMPPRTYMGIDDRRDHRFGVPDPRLSQIIGAPDACTHCHEDKSASWALKQLESGRKTDDYAGLMASARRTDPQVVPGAVRYVASVDNAAIKRASLLAALPLTQASVQLAIEMLSDPSELVRVGAVRLLAAMPLEVRYQPLLALIDDPSKVVRLAAARALTELIPHLRVEDAGGLISAVGEYRNSLALDTPAGQSELGLLELRLGRRSKAIEALEQAIRIEPHFVPALLNLADIHRERANEAKSMDLLSRAVDVAPDSGAANHSLGLGLVRQGEVRESLKYLEAATQQHDRQPRYAYVYAVALDSLGRTEQAVKVLHEASETWPNQKDLISLEAAYKGKIQ